MKIAFTFVAFLCSGLAFAAFAPLTNDPFRPEAFVGSYRVDPSRSDSDCIHDKNQTVQIRGDQHVLRVQVDGVSDPGFALGGATIQFERINEPAQVVDGDGFDHYTDVSSCEYQSGVLTQLYNSQDPPYPATVETTQLKRNSDGSVSLSRNTSGLALDAGPSTFSCTLIPALTELE